MSRIVVQSCTLNTTLIMFHWRLPIYSLKATPAIILPETRNGYACLSSFFFLFLWLSPQINRRQWLVGSGDLWSLWKLENWIWFSISFCFLSVHNENKILKNAQVHTWIMQTLCRHKTASSPRNYEHSRPNLTFCTLLDHFDVYNQKHLILVCSLNILNR